MSYEIGDYPDVHRHRVSWFRFQVSKLNNLYNHIFLWISNPWRPTGAFLFKSLNHSFSLFINLKILIKFRTLFLNESQEANFASTHLALLFWVVAPWFWWQVFCRWASFVKATIKRSFLHCFLHFARLSITLSATVGIGIAMEESLILFFAEILTILKWTKLFHIFYLDFCVFKGDSHRYNSFFLLNNLHLGWWRSSVGDFLFFGIDGAIVVSSTVSDAALRGEIAPVIFVEFPITLAPTAVKIVLVSRFSSFVIADSSSTMLDTLYFKSIAFISTLRFSIAEAPCAVPLLAIANYFGYFFLFY